MHGFRWNDPRLVLSLVLGVMARDARAENLRDAWTIALGTNAQLQASRQTSAAASQELASSRSARLPQIQTLNAQAFLSNPVSVPSSSGQPRAASGGQDLFTISAVAAIVPIYTGGRIRNTVASNRAQLNASRADEATTALDLKLEVARAYVDVLRANRGVAVAESNVVSLTAQARDVANLVTQGRGIRNDLLAAQVARANAQQRNIQARNRLSIAWATYNRYLCRSMDTVVPLEELAHERRQPPPRSGDAADTAMLMQDAEPIVVDEAQIQTMVLYAMKNRPELASLAEQVALDPRPGRRRTGQHPAPGQLPGRQPLPERAIPAHRGRQRRGRLRPELDPLRRRQVAPPRDGPGSSALPPVSAGSTTSPRASSSRSARHG